MNNPHYERMTERLRGLRDNAKTERQYRHYDSLLEDLENVGTEYEAYIEKLESDIVAAQVPDYDYENGE